jgi:tetraacyldisaccharide 4'-kinase
VLDDGFQHVAIGRDEDIVVIDCTAPFGFGHLLPRGLLREPLSALRRATGFLLTRTDEREHAHIVDGLRQTNPTAEIFKSRHRPVRLVGLKEGIEAPLNSLSGRRVLALSSIGNPKSFEETLRRLGADVVRSLRFKDHHWYDSADIERIRSEAERCSAEHIVSTEKDGVRLALAADAPENMLLLQIELEVFGRDPLKTKGKAPPE